jgi:GntR family transcriptional regulator, transcriptional repressor for pyruvate dehydrogenase complex
MGRSPVIGPAGAILNPLLSDFSTEIDQEISTYRKLADIYRETSFLNPAGQAVVDFRLTLEGILGNHWIMVNDRFPPTSKNILDRLVTESVPIRNESVTEQLVRQIKDWALRGLVKPGERLPPERELAAALNVSRSALRQALKALQVMGLLEVKQGSGNYLSESADRILREPIDLLMPLRGISFAELFEARRSIEAEAAERAASRASEKDFEKLRHELEQMRLNLQNPDLYFRHDVAFHRAIAIGSGNSVFIWFVELVSKVLRDAWLAKAREGRSDRTFREHEAIFEALYHRNPEEARAAMLAHLTLDKFYSYDRTPVELRVMSPRRG